MEPFRFRIRFHFSPGDYLDSDVPVLVLSTANTGPTLRLKAGARGSSIKDHSRLGLVGGPYESEAEASTAAERARRALLEWAVRDRFPLDLGDGHVRSFITDYGRQLMEGGVGLAVRNDIHGVDVYQGSDQTAFVSFNPTLTVGRSVARFTDAFLSAFNSPGIVSDKQATASELFCSSYFDVSFRSRFITLVTAVESLLALAPRPHEAVKVVESMGQLLQESDIDDSNKQAMLSSLSWFRLESIRSTGKALTMSLLGQAEYDGMQATRFWAHCYDIRSQIVHDGKPRESGIDLLALSNSAQRFVGDLLVASF